MQITILKNKNISFILLLFITSFLIGIAFIPNVNASSNNLRYDFKKNILDTSDKTNINLRHNNIITGDYNGTYSFANDINGNVPIGWNNLSVGNGRTVALITTYDKHYALMRLQTIDTDDARIEQEFDDGSQTEGTIEFWFQTSNAEYPNYISVLFGATEAIKFRCTNYIFQIYESLTPITLDTISIDNIWYHIKMVFNCTSDKLDLYINDYYEGNFDFNIDVISVDILDIRNEGSAGGFSIYFDAIGYSWSSNYTINDNKYPNIEIVDSNIFSKDKYEFNFDSNGILYEYGTSNTNICGWESIYENEYFIRSDYSINTTNFKNINGIKIFGTEVGVGVKNDTLQIYSDKINITFGLQFIIVPNLIGYFNLTIESIGHIEVIYLIFNITAENTIDLLYYDGSVYNNLVQFININQNDVYNFNLYIEGFNVKLRYYKNDVYNNSYTFPLIFNSSGINSISFLSYCFDYSVWDDIFVIRMNYIGIYQFDVSLCKEFGYIRYILPNNWDFNEYNLFKVISNQYIKIIVHSFLSIDYFKFREFDNNTFFWNLMDIENTLENPYLYLIIQSNLNLSEYLLVSIEGIRLNKYINSVFANEMTIQYYFHNVNINQSYYYVDDSNRLHYQMSITQNDTWEYMMLYFNFVRHISSNNMSIYFKCRKLSIDIGKPYIAMTYYQPPDDKFYLETYPITINTLLKRGKEFRRFHFIANDLNNNNYTSFTSEGYLYGLQFNYVPFGIIPTIDVITLSLIAIMIPLIVILVPTFSIHMVYRKKEIIIPMLILFSIIAFATTLIPFQIFFIIMLSLGCGLFLQYKKQKE